jgi:hypothetical protein
MGCQTGGLVPAFPDCASGGGGVAGSYLDIEDATLIGADFWTQSGDTITATVPIPAGAVSTLGGATGCASFLVWPLGPLAGTTGNLTVADVMGVLMEMEFVSLPSDNNVRLLLPFGIVASTATTPAGVDFAADKSRWASAYAGGGVSTPGTTVGLAAQNNNLSPATAAVSRTAAVNASAVASLTPRASVFEVESLATVLDGTAASRSNNSNGDDFTATWNLYAFVGVGRAITSGDTVAPEIKLHAGALRRAT